MLDRNRAFTILGLPEEATSQDIEHRYFILVKKYKYLAQDEMPSPGEPIFAIINEAYRFLIGYVPMQKVIFRELKWKEKFQHIRDNFMMEISFSVIIVLVVCGIVIGTTQIYREFKAVTGNSVSSPLRIPHPENEGNK
jgi:hypothetical protein